MSFERLTKGKSPSKHGDEYSKFDFAHTQPRTRLKLFEHGFRIRNGTNTLPKVCLNRVERGLEAFRTRKSCEVKENTQRSPSAELGWRPKNKVFDSNGEANMEGARQIAPRA